MREVDDRAAKNQEIVEALRATFAPLIERLTPEVEPSTIYVLCENAREPEPGPQHDK